MLDVHNIVFQRLTQIVNEGLSLDELVGREGLSEVDGDSKCQFCSRKINEQPKEFGALSYSYNSYGSEKTLCVCCGAFFFNRHEIMGVENPKNPTTGNKFGMLAGCGAFIDIEAKRVYLFMPKKIIDKLPQSTLAVGQDKYNIQFIESTKLVEQLSLIAELALTTPSVWISNFGRITNQLIANLIISPSYKEMYEVNAESINSCNYISQVYDVECLLKIAKLLSETKGVANFNKLMFSSWNGRITPAQLIEEIKSDKMKAFIPVLQLLPKDPHQAQTYLSKAKDLKL